MRTGTTGRRFSTCAKKTYSFDFARCGFTPAQEANVLGVEGRLFQRTVRFAQSRNTRLSRLHDLSARLRWPTGLERRGARVDGVYRRLRSHYDRMGAQGIRFPPDAAPCELRDGVLTAAVDDDSQRPSPSTVRSRSHRSDSDGRPVFTFSAAATAAARSRRWAHRPITAR